MGVASGISHVGVARVAFAMIVEVPIFVRHKILQHRPLQLDVRVASLPVLDTYLRGNCQEYASTNATVGSVTIASMFADSPLLYIPLRRRTVMDRSDRRSAVVTTGGHSDGRSRRSIAGMTGYVHPEPIRR